MFTRSLHRTAQRAIASLVCWSLILGQVMLLEAQAQTVPPALSDIPIAAKVSAKPNIVYTVDDSGSMQYNYLPDYVVNNGQVVSLSTLTRVGSVATGTAIGTGLNTFQVGDWVNVIGANEPEFNGFVQITNKPVANQFKYNLATTPVAVTATVAPGYGNIQVVLSSAYCRGGNSTVPCAMQALNIASTGTAIPTTSITRPAPITTSGPVTATATGSALNFAPLNTGDYVLIQNTAAAPIPATSSAPYYGVFQITKTSATTFTYTIQAIGAAGPSQTPLSAAGNRQVVIQGGSLFAHPPLHASDFNRLAYNPNVTYTAPVIYTALKPLGTPLTNTGTDAVGNYATTSLLWATASVDRDPYASYETAAGVTPMWAATVKDQLSIKIAVPLYCNTDWPLLVNDSNWPSGAGGATAMDAGDQNGQYRAGSGGWCRINGTAYDAQMSGSMAPAAVEDYNYPWQSSSGAKGAQYFYQQLSVKTLWCDKTSPYWPRNGVIVGCTAGGTPTGGTSQAQFCKSTTSMVCNPTVALRTYTTTSAPLVACDTSQTFCSPPGSGSSPECRACACDANYSQTVKQCRVVASPGTGSNAACVVDADCPPYTTNPTGCSAGNPIYGGPATSAACTAFLWDPVAGVSSNNPASSMYPGITLTDDAGAPNNAGPAKGTTCRHNNMSYQDGTTAGLFKYNASTNWPGEGAGTGAFVTITQSGCPAVGVNVSIPRHYYVVDSVQFCDNRVVTTNDQWKGFGAGVCQANNDLQHFKEVKYGRFTRIDLFPNNTKIFAGNSQLPASTTPYPNSRAWLAATSPDPSNSESINYANWYAYYSTRLLAAKTTSSIAFSFLTPRPGEAIAYRVGFHNLGEEPSGMGGSGTPIIWVNVKDWDLTQRQNWTNALFGIAVNIYKTPTIDAMIRIGNLFETGGSAGVPATVNPLPPGAADPIDVDKAGNKISCQNNYHILFTDGKTNQVQPTAIPGSVASGDEDATIPNAPNTMGTIVQTPPDQVIPNFPGGGAWPKPFKQGSPAIPNTLADVATRYWAYDLRPTLKNDVPSASGKGGGDLDPAKDVAWWQHVNFNAISFGAEGTLDASNQPATIAALKAGTITWPNLTQPENPIYPRGAAAGAVAVDDLWHATVNSRGSFVLAKSPVEVSYGLASILAGIQNQRKSRAAAAFGSQTVSSSGGNNIVYEATIEPGWAGDLLKVEIDPTDGHEVQTLWQASTTLAAQIAPASPGDEPWMDETKRRIVTLAVDPGTFGTSSGPGAPFRFANLTSNQLKSLANTSTQQQKIIAYLRGGSTYSGAVIEGTGIGEFRKRSGPLGDISDAQAAIVGPPNRGYKNATDPGYETYASSNASRSSLVVAAANDGMVHVFDAGPNSAAPGGGTEVFAFIPKALFRGVAGNTATEDATGIQALTYQDGGVPIFKHHFYVNATPRVADVDFGGGDWHTIVVGGLGKGGNSYYALDLTDPAATTEANAAAKVMWEWTDPTGDLKYSYGRPVIVKLRETGYPNGRWVALVTAGYNNVSGKGKIHVLDAKTGALLRTFTTTAGAAGNPSGLAQIHAFVKDRTNQIAEQIYGGDLFGNLWRIDVGATDSYLTANPVLFAELKDKSGVGQPITTAPQIEIDIHNGIDRYVFIGTGRLLDVSDFTDPPVAQQQTMYAIRDGTLQTPETTGLPIQPRATLRPINSDRINAIVSGAPNGWYDDLPTTPVAERVVVDVQADVNTVTYVGTQAQDDPCVISLPATLYARDYTSAASVLLDPNDPSASAAIVYGIPFAEGIVGSVNVGLLGSGVQELGILVSQEIPGTKPVRIRNALNGPGRRMSWRLLTGE